MRTLALLISLAFVLNINAQQLKTKITPRANDLKNLETYHRYGNRFFGTKITGGKERMFKPTITKVKYGLELIQFDENLKETKSLSLDNDAKDLGPFRPMIRYANNAIHAIYYKLREGKITMFLASVDPQSLTVNQTLEIITYDPENQKLWDAATKNLDPEIYFNVSEDNKNLMIIHKAPDMIFTAVLNENLDFLHKPEMLQMDLLNVRLQASIIGNDGTKVIAYQYNDYWTRGVYVQPLGEKGTFVDIKIPEGFYPGYFFMKAARDGRSVILGGDYYGAPKGEGGKGVMMVKLDVTAKSVSAPAFYPYTDELKQRILDLDFANKRKGQIDLKDKRLAYRIEEMENGTVVLSADLHFETYTEKYSYFFVGPIIHAFIKPDGNAKMTLIPKKQADNSSTGYFTIVANNRLLCIYGDDPKHAEKERSDKQITVTRNSSKVVPILAILDSDGNILSKKIMIDEDTFRGTVDIGLPVKTGNNQFLFSATRPVTGMSRYSTFLEHIWTVEVE